jgi:hypothetical protein
VVPGLSNRNGHRRRKGNNKKRKLFENENEEVILSLSDIGMFIETQEVAKIWFHLKQELDLYITKNDVNWLKI